MKKELFYQIKSRLEGVYHGDCEIIKVAPGEAAPSDSERVFPTVDLYRSFDHQADTPYTLPAVLIEFGDVRWVPVVPFVEYRGEAEVRLHVITNWYEQKTLAEQCGVFELTDILHDALAGIDGDTFGAFDLSESIIDTGSNELVDNVEVYTLVAMKHMVR